MYGFMWNTYVRMQFNATRIKKIVQYKCKCIAKDIDLRSRLNIHSRKYTIHCNSFITFSTPQTYSKKTTNNIHKGFSIFLCQYFIYYACTLLL